VTGKLITNVQPYKVNAYLGHGWLLTLCSLSAFGLWSSPKVADDLTADTMKHVG